MTEGSPPSIFCRPAKYNCRSACNLTQIGRVRGRQDYPLPHPALTIAGKIPSAIAAPLVRFGVGNALWAPC